MIDSGVWVHSLLSWWQVSVWVTLTQNLCACRKWGACFTKESERVFEPIVLCRTVGPRAGYTQGEHSWSLYTV